MQVHTLVNPTLDSFRNAQKSLEPNILYFQGEQLENEEDIGMLVWGDLDVSEPEMFSSLIVPPLPTIVSTMHSSNDLLLRALALLLPVCWTLSLKFPRVLQAEYCSKLSK